MLDGLYTLKEILAPAEEHGFAVGAFCIANAEMGEAVMAAAQAEQAPVIIMVGPMEELVLGLPNFASIVRTLARNYDIPICLHLDHAVRLEMVMEALEAGFPSVMIDYSDRATEENIAATRQVVAVARQTGASVESEIGHVGLADGTSSEVITAESFLTEPEEAAAFAEATGVDALAISIGTAHGLGAGRPKLDFERLAEIDRRISVPLVLHGATGRDPEQVREAISLGIRKVNIASDLARVFADTMAQALKEGDGFFWHGVALVKLKKNLQPVVRGHIRTLGSSGRAAQY